MDLASWSNSDTISTITGLATLANSLLVGMTLKEMKGQKTLSAQPDLFFSERSISFYNDNRGFPSIELEKQLKPVIKQPFLLPIDLTNIGNGIAKNIKITWLTNPIELFNSLPLAKLSSSDSIKIKTKNSFISIDINDIINASIRYDNLENSYGFIMPKKNDKQLVSIPTIYSCFFSVYVYCYRSLNSSLNSLPNIPIKGIISYQDIIGNTYKYNFEITASIYAIIVTNTPHEQCAHGYITIKKSD